MFTVEEKNFEYQTTEDSLLPHREEDGKLPTIEPRYQLTSVELPLRRKFSQPRKSNRSRSTSIL